MTTQLINDTDIIHDWTMSGLTRRCSSNEHLPENIRALTTGLYKHACPACGKVSYFRIKVSDSVVDVSFIVAVPDVHYVKATT